MTKQETVKVREIWENLKKNEKNFFPKKVFKKLTSLGAEAAAGAPAIITGASDIFNLVLRREFRSATSSRFSWEISSTRRTIFSGNTFKYKNMTNKEVR